MVKFTEIKQLFPIFKNKKVIFAVVLLAVLISLSYLYFAIFFAKEECSTEDCFLENLKDCKKTSFSSLQEDLVWFYVIKGAQGESCKVLVKVTEIRTETSEKKSFEGKEMMCYIPKGIAIMPDSKIEYCHGILKEGIQDQIIEQMHLYIVQKISQIEKEFEAGSANKTTNATLGNATLQNTTAENTTSQNTTSQNGSED